MKIIINNKNYIRPVGKTSQISNDGESGLTTYITKAAIDSETDKLIAKDMLETKVDAKSLADKSNLEHTEKFRVDSEELVAFVEQFDSEYNATMAILSTLPTKVYADSEDQAILTTVDAKLEPLAEVVDRLAEIMTAKKISKLVNDGEDGLTQFTTEKYVDDAHEEIVAQAEQDRKNFIAFIDSEGAKVAAKIPMKTSGYNNDSGYITEAEYRLKHDSTKQDVITDIDTIRRKLVSVLTTYEFTDEQWEFPLDDGTTYARRVFIKND